MAMCFENFFLLMLISALFSQEISKKLAKPY